MRKSVLIVIMNVLYKHLFSSEYNFLIDTEQYTIRLLQNDMNTGHLKEFSQKLKTILLESNTLAPTP